MALRLAVWSTGYARGFGGAEQAVNALLRRFPRNELDALLITSGERGAGMAGAHFPPLPDEIAVHVDRFDNPLLEIRRPAHFLISLSRYAAAARRLIRVLRHHRPAVVHLHFVSVDVLLLALYKLFFRYRLVITFRGADLTIATRSRLGHLKVWLALMSADAVTAVSQQMAADLRATFGATHVAYIPNGVDPAEIRAASAAPPPSTLPPDHFVYAGRLHPDKQVTLLVDIFKDCVDSGCDRNLYLIGDGDDREAVADRIARHGLRDRVFLLGAMSRSHVLSALARSRALLLTSREEGCPNVVLEAMGVGIPVIASSVGGVPDLIGHGDTGYLFSLDDPRTAVPQILRLAGDPGHARAMGQRAADAVQRRFGLAATVQQYMVLYRSLLEPPRSSPSAT